MREPKNAKDPKGSEVVADAQREDDDLPRVHGHGWDETEPRDGRETVDASEDDDIEPRDGHDRPKRDDDDDEDPTSSKR